MKIPAPIIALLQKAINTALSLDAEARAALISLDRKVIQIRILGPDADLFLIVVDQIIEVTGCFDDTVDTTVAGTPLALASMMRNTSAVFTGDVEIQGDIECGRKIRRLIAQFDIDWEEQFSHVLGGTAAHQLGRIHREFTSLVFGTATNLRLNGADYFTEESKALVGAKEAKPYLDQVDDTREWLDRLEFRINSLIDRRGGKAE